MNSFSQLAHLEDKMLPMQNVRGQDTRGRFNSRIAGQIMFVGYIKDKSLININKNFYDLIDLINRRCSGKDTIPQGRRGGVQEVAHHLHQQSEQGIGVTRHTCGLRQSESQQHESPRDHIQAQQLRST